MLNTNIYKYADEEKIKEIMSFSEGYKDFLNNSKIERLAVKTTVKLATEKGFKNIDDVKTIKPGDKLYKVNKKKNVILFVVGKKPITDGLRILGAHIDSPRLDLKAQPLYEDSGFTLLDTHYYGGIKKYQWVTTPLSIIGVIYKKDGTALEINIGEEENDPIFGIGDLLVHLSASQLTKDAAKAIEGEDLDVTFSSMQSKDKNVKEYILDFLKEKYGIIEEDFISAELEVVPSMKAKDYGIDRSMVAGYGHDDKVCAYPSVMAIFDMKDVEYTSCVILTDKEEIGSVGATGAHSLFFENSVAELLIKSNDDNYYSLKKALENSKMLSCDVTGALDPLYSNASDKKNSSYLNRGISFEKYTGSRGKSQANDSNAEYVAYIRKVMEDNNIFYQFAELGKVDKGGGGTIAYILAKYNMDVIDAGVPVLNMHAPMEIISKADIYEAYLAYKAFLNN